MNKTALVTGGNRGIGLATVWGLAQAGCKVLLGSRSVDDAKDAVGDAAASDIHVVEMDLSNSESTGNHIAKAMAMHGGIDILVNNAGIYDEEDFLTGTIQGMQTSLQVHLLGPMQLMQAVLPGMLERNFGRIVNLTSGYGSFYEGLQGPLNYSTSKAALNALTMTAARRVDGTNIKINAMCPGWVHTRMGGKDAPRTPEQGADTAIWLATLSDDGPNGLFFRDRKQINW